MVTSEAAALLSVLFFCVLQDTADWAERDARGNPVIECCWRCLDVALSIRPGAEIADLIKFFQLGQGCEDPGFEEDMKTAILVQENPEEADFKVKSKVAERKAFGYMIFQDFGCLTPAEYGALCGHLPADLKRKGEKFTWEGPDNLNQYHIINMAGLPVEVTNPMRKARIFYECSCNHDMHHLLPEQQLLEQQGHSTFGSVAKSHVDERPAPLRPASKMSMTVDELKKKHAEAESEALASAGAQAQAVRVKEEDEEASDDPDNADDAAMRPRKRHKQAGVQSSRANRGTGGKGKGKGRKGTGKGKGGGGNLGAGQAPAARPPPVFCPCCTIAASRATACDHRWCRQSGYRESVNSWQRKECRAHGLRFGCGHEGSGRGSCAHQG